MAAAADLLRSSPARCSHMLRDGSKASTLDSVCPQWFPPQTRIRPWETAAAAADLACAIGASGSQASRAGLKRSHEFNVLASSLPPKT